MFFRRAAWAAVARQLKSSSMHRGCTNQCSSAMSCGFRAASGTGRVGDARQSAAVGDEPGRQLRATLGSKDHVAVLQAFLLSALVFGASEPASHCQQFVDRPLVVGVSAILGGFNFSVGADEEFCGQSQNAVGRHGR